MNPFTITKRCNGGGSGRFPDGGRCERCGGQVAWVGICANGILVLMKVYVGLVSGSKSCIADGLHSFSNIVTACAILVSRKISRRERNEAYPLGFGKVEFLAAGFVSLLIIGAALLIIAASIGQMFRGGAAPPHLSAVLAAIVSIGANEMLFRYMRCAGTRLKSQTILANAWANRADTVSSIAVIMGVLGARLGFRHLDAICALVVVAIIIRVSAHILMESIKALMDSSANTIYGEEITAIVTGMEGVLGISDLKTRHVGQKIWAELDLRVDPEKNMGECRVVAQRVKRRLLRQVRDLERIVVYFSPAGNGGHSNDVKGCRDVTTPLNAD